jgi:inorganic pyrophosphatase
MNLWHDVSRGKNIPKEMNVIIEIPKNSQNKYEIDKDTGLIALDRANYSSAAYPFDYGYVPQTLWDDNDALDVVVLTTYPLAVGILVAVRPIAIMRMIDTGESDYKIISVPVNDKRWEDIHDLSDINKHSLKEMAHFFETYKELKKGEKNVVQVNGYGDKEEAIEAVKKSMKLYDDKYSK